jgi:hypothetical protein
MAEQPSVQQSGPLLEGLKVASAWFVLAVIGWAILTAFETRGIAGIFDVSTFPLLLGALLLSSLVMAVAIAALTAWRNQSHVSSFVLLDWRFWLVTLSVALLGTENLVAWAWCTGIYQLRQFIRTRRLAKTV